MTNNDVFISYSTKNSKVADDVRMLFESHGITCWMAPYSIPGGSNYTREIPYGIMKAKTAVLILSMDSIKSVWVQKEVEYVLDLEIPIIPFIIDDVKPSCVEEPFSIVIKQDNAVNVKNGADMSYLLLTVQRQLARYVDEVEFNSSDDLLQLGLKEVGEDGGLLYDRGKAEYYLRKASEMGNATAMRHLAILLYDICATGDTEYELWFEKASEAGDIYSRTRKAWRLYNANDTDKDAMEDAMALLESGPKDEDSSAMELYARLLLKKDIPYYNPQTAIEYLERATVAGNLDACALLGTINRDGEHVEVNQKLAFEYFSNAERGSALARACLGDCYFNGFGTERNLDKAFDYYSHSYLHGDEYYEKYADCFYYGYGTDVNLETAAEEYWNILQGCNIDEIKNSEIKMRVLAKCVELGHGAGEAAAGSLYLETGEYEKAFELFTHSNYNDNAEGALGLAKCYYYGWGTDVSYDEAFILFSRAFSMGNKDAAKYIAESYKYGKGIEINPEKALYFDSVDKQDEYGQWKVSLMTEEDY